MSGITAGEIRSFLIDRYSNELSGLGLNPLNISDDFDLITEGVIDSLAFLDLVTAIEEEFQLEIDFDEIDAEEMTIIGPLCQYIERRCCR